MLNDKAMMKSEVSWLFLGLLSALVAATGDAEPRNKRFFPDLSGGRATGEDGHLLDFGRYLNSVPSHGGGGANTGLHVLGLEDVVNYPIETGKFGLRNFKMANIGQNRLPQVIPGVSIQNKRQLSITKLDSSGNADFARVALAETNKYRAMHQAGPLTLDPKLTAGCQEWANELAATNTLEHSCTDDCSEYGENLWMTGGIIPSSAEAAQEAVKSWYDEVKMYDWSNPEFAWNTGHFTALVWKETTSMGIALATNPNTKSAYVVARFDPPGNMDGEFAENVLPLLYS